MQQREREQLDGWNEYKEREKKKDSYGVCSPLFQVCSSSVVLEHGAAR